MPSLSCLHVALAPCSASRPRGSRPLSTHRPTTTWPPPPTTHARHGTTNHSRMHTHTLICLYINRDVCVRGSKLHTLSQAPYAGATFSAWHPNVGLHVIRLPSRHHPPSRHPRPRAPNTPHKPPLHLHLLLLRSLLYHHHHYVIFRRILRGLSSQFSARRCQCCWSPGAVGVGARTGRRSPRGDVCTWLRAAGLWVRETDPSCASGPGQGYGLTR